MEEEEARRKEEEEEARRRAEEEEAAKQAQEAQKKREEEEKQIKQEPQTREDPDIELVTEEMLDDNVSIQEEGKSSSHTDEEELDKDEELEDEDEESRLESNGTLAEAGPQLDEKDEENQTQGQLDSEPVLPSDGVTPNALISPSQVLDKQSHSTTSTSSTAEQDRTQAPPLHKGRSQEKREQRRRRGLEHNQRETDRAASSSLSSPNDKEQTSPPKSKTQETSKLKERSESKELDQYTFVAWKVKEEKGGKKEAKSSPPPVSGPVRPSSLSLRPSDTVSERNGLGDNGGAVNLQRRGGAFKEKPEKWKGRRSEGEYPESTSTLPLHNREERRRKPLYVFCHCHILQSTFMLEAWWYSQFVFFFNKSQRN